jgi:hypothetical protein
MSTLFKDCLWALAGSAFAVTAPMLTLHLLGLA